LNCSNNLVVALQPLKTLKSLLLIIGIFELDILWSSVVKNLLFSFGVPA
jgi:hypothetical protein